MPTRVTVHDAKTNLSELQRGIGQEAYALDRRYPTCECCHASKPVRLDLDSSRTYT